MTSTGWNFDPEKRPWVMPPIMLVSLLLMAAAALTTAGIALRSTQDPRDAFSYRLGENAAFAAGVYYKHAATDLLSEACSMAFHSRHPEREYRGRTVVEDDFMKGCLQAFVGDEPFAKQASLRS